MSRQIVVAVTLTAVGATAVGQSATNARHALNVPSQHSFADSRIDQIARWCRQAVGLAPAVALPCADAQPSQQCLRVAYSPDSLRLVLPRVFLLSAQQTYDSQYIGARLALTARWWPSPDAPFVRQQWTLLRGLGGWRVAPQDSLLIEYGRRETATPFGAIHLGRARGGVRRGTAFFSDWWDTYPHEARGEAVARSGRCTLADTTG